jgi:hypothetical protein
MVVGHRGLPELEGNGNGDADLPGRDEHRFVRRV